MPEKMSLTRVWAPKPTATPTTPAPASSGPIWTPIEDSAISTAVTPITTSRTLRRIGSSVRSRAWRRASSAAIGSSAGATCSRLSIAVRARCHTKSATSRIAATLKVARTIRVASVSPVASATRSKPSAQASASTLPMISRARMPRSMQIARTLIEPSGRRSGSMRRNAATRVWTGCRTNGSAQATATNQKAAVAAAPRR